MASDYSNLTQIEYSEFVQDQVRDSVIRTSIAVSKKADKKTMENPIVDNAYAGDVTSAGQYFVESIGSQSDTYDVDTFIESNELVTVKDALSSSYGLNIVTADNHGKALARREDQETILAPTTNLSNTITDGDLLAADQTNGGGEAGIIATQSNVFDVIDLGIKAAYDSSMKYGENVIQVIPNEIGRLIKARMRDTGNVVADDALKTKAGYVGTNELGVDLYMSNLLRRQSTFTFGTGQPSNGETVTVNGVTGTFVISLGSTAGNILIGADVDETAENAAAFFSHVKTYGTGAGTQYIAPTAAQRVLMRKNNMSATNGTALFTVFVQDAVMTVASTVTGAANVWGDVTVESVMYQKDTVYFYRLMAAGSDLLKRFPTAQVSDAGIITMFKDGGTGSLTNELVTAEIIGANMWANSTGYGAVMKFKQR